MFKLKWILIIIVIVIIYKNCFVKPKIETFDLPFVKANIIYKPVKLYTAISPGSMVDYYLSIIPCPDDSCNNTLCLNTSLTNTNFIIETRRDEDDFTKVLLHSKDLNYYVSSTPPLLTTATPLSTTTPPSTTTPNSSINNKYICVDMPYSHSNNIEFIVTLIEDDKEIIIQNRNQEYLSLCSTQYSCSTDNIKILCMYSTDPLQALRFKLKFE